MEMSLPPEALKTLGAFVSGDMSAKTFEQALYSTPEIEAFLSAEKAPSYCHTGTTVFHYLIGLDYDDPGDVLNAHGLLVQILAKHKFVVKPSDVPGRDYDLLLSAQPKWMNADSKYLASLLASAPPLAEKERKAWLRNKILETFRYIKHSPRWLQAPSWPISDSGPMVFLGQIDIDHYFHDTAAAYLFHDPATGEIRSVIQMC